LDNTYIESSNYTTRRKSENVELGMGIAMKEIG
jgi:hypothetical protein